MNALNRPELPPAARTRATAGTLAFEKPLLSTAGRRL
jgi:hypothetical protein